MYPKGHKGIAYILYAPLMAFLFLQGHPASIAAGVFGFILISAFVMIPDKDISMPFMTHRGISHTIFAAFLFAVGLAFVAMFFLPLFSVLGIAAGPFLAFMFSIGMFAIIAHLIGDVITPTGISPFKPFFNRSFSLGLTRASNSVSNWVLYIFGWIAIILAGLFGLGIIA